MLGENRTQSASEHYTCNDIVHVCTDMLYLVPTAQIYVERGTTETIKHKANSSHESIEVTIEEINKN